jgi:hypothetical protein
MIPSYAMKFVCDQIQFFKVLKKQKFMSITKKHLNQQRNEIKIDKYLFE